MGKGNSSFLNFGFNPPAFPLPNPISNPTNPNPSHHIIEMIGLLSKSYTSLTDLLPDSPSPTTGWREEIPIKDPLLQHAAWAYLQPMGPELQQHHCWWSRFTGSCCGCFNALLFMVFGPSKGVKDHWWITVKKPIDKRE